MIRQEQGVPVDSAKQEDSARPHRHHGMYPGRFPSSSTPLKSRRSDHHRELSGWIRSALVHSVRERGCVTAAVLLGASQGGSSFAGGGGSPPDAPLSPLEPALSILLHSRRTRRARALSDGVRLVAGCHPYTIERSEPATRTAHPTPTRAGECPTCVKRRRSITSLGDVPAKRSRQTGRGAGAWSPKRAFPTLPSPRDDIHPSQTAQPSAASLLCHARRGRRLAQPRGAARPHRRWHWRKSARSRGGRR